MLQLKKYLKPFLTSLLLAIGLLLIQAFCDLNLPNYMSNIVNIGIQQNGIKNAVPIGLSKDAYDFLQLFMTPEEKELLADSYSFQEGTAMGSNKKPLGETFPKAQSTPIYALNADIGAETLTELDKTFGVSIWTMIEVLKAMPSPQTHENNPSGTAIDITALYNLKPLLTQMDGSIIKQARQQAESMDIGLLTQSATMLLGGFYQELGVDLAQFQSRYILNMGSLMLLIALISGVATIFVSLLSSKIAAGVAQNLRNDIFRKVTSFSNGDYDTFSTASLITRSTNDVTQIQQLLAIGIRMICYAPLMAVGGIIMALRKSVSMGWIIALASILLIGLMLVIFSIVLPKFKTMQKLIDRVNLVARETLTGLMVIRAFGTRTFEEERFDKANGDLTSTNLFVNRIMSILMPSMMLIMNGTSVIIIWIGSKHVAQSTMQVGDMMAFMQYSMQIIMSFLMISMLFILIPRASVSAARIAEVLQATPSILDPETSKEMVASKRGVVEFQNVSFRYGNAKEDILKDISFVAKPGETTAFIGATGTGKSTLLNLIPRFYDATEGVVTVNGVNVKEISQKELHSRIGYVPQKSLLLSGTIRSNITYGKDDATESQLKEATTIAQAMDFIEQKPKGFEDAIAQGGTNVSGGQRQRLSIARALAVQPDIYLFDDSFSALDFKTDATLRQALKQHTQDRTVIIVAQRVSTILDADKIYVMDDGQFVGQGTHKELLKNCPTYYEIASSQLSKEELEQA